MDLLPFIKERIPGVIRGVTQMVAASVAQPAAMADPSPAFMEKRLAILTKYQEELRGKGKAPAAIVVPSPGIVPEAVAECPYCTLEELAGTVRNHMLFVAQECREDDLAPATGGMIPKAKATTEDFIRKVSSLDAPPHIKLVAHLAVMKAEELLPKLGWIDSCEEAQEAATIADEMWHRAAKATQMYYTSDSASPYA